MTQMVRRIIKRLAFINTGDPRWSAITLIQKDSLRNSTFPMKKFREIRLLVRKMINGPWDEDFVCYPTWTNLSPIRSL